MKLRINSKFVSWFLLENNEEKGKGNFQIVPNDETKTNLESYLGPPSTLAGDNHYVMFVTIPTDNLDNPKLPNTDVVIKHQFLNNISTENEKTKNFIAWATIYAPTKSGIVLISASCNDALTKEFDAVIYPSIATDFMISYQRNHDFADGNQITKLTTSILKDKFGNTVSDGTMVTFIIKNKENAFRSNVKHRCLFFEPPFPKWTPKSLKHRLQHHLATNLAPKLSDESL